MAKKSTAGKTSKTSKKAPGRSTQTAGAGAICAVRCPTCKAECYQKKGHSGNHTDFSGHSWKQK